ncbi:bifunctional DNA primase/polymerase [Streptomyces sp. NPDC088816]|uniref:bifunctional DNA primase/polymerase n=1 Tax=Streptomyces sp. NPDC088816 TaxID=3365906 RepID=UPI00382A5A36
MHNYSYSSADHLDLGAGLGGSAAEAPIESWQGMVCRGFRVFPLKGKVPAVKWKNDASTDPGWIAQQLSRPGITGYGVVMGSGVLAVDTDTPEAEQWASSALPATFTVRTTKGFHRYYRVPFPSRNSSQHSTVRIADGTDVRGDGGYVVGPGSRHPSGAVYQVSSDLPIADLPEEFHDQVRAPEPRAQRAKNAHGGVTPPVLLNAQRSDALVSVFADDPRVKTRTRQLLQDVCDGRDFRLARVLLSLMRSGLSDEECVLQVMQSPLGGKVREKGGDYLVSKVTYIRTYVTEHPSVRFTPERWRERAAGTTMPSGMRKTVDAIALIATQADATKLVLSSYKVAEMSAQGQQAAARNITKLVQAGWLRLNTKTNVQGRGYARSYTLTVPASSCSSERLGVVDIGMDSWRHACKAHWYPLYTALLVSRGQVKELAHRTGKSLPTVRRQLTEMQGLGLTRKTGKVWSLTEDADLQVQTLAVGTKAEGAQERQKQRNQEIRAARAMELELLTSSGAKTEPARRCGQSKADGSLCRRASRSGACPQHRGAAEQTQQGPQEVTPEAAERLMEPISHTSVEGPQTVLQKPVTTLPQQRVPASLKTTQEVVVVALPTPEEAAVVALPTPEAAVERLPLGQQLAVTTATVLAPLAA